MTAVDREAVTVLGRDSVGTVAENGYMRFYLSGCCGASAKGCGPYDEYDEGYVGCRACYADIGFEMGDARSPGEDLIGGPLIEIYGDGLPYDGWKARYVK